MIEDVLDIAYLNIIVKDIFVQEYTRIISPMSEHVLLYERS
jgi:hypothetical protein